MGQDRWTAAEYRRFLETGREPLSADMMLRDASREGPEKRSKFGSRKAEEDGIVFDSQHEHRVYQWLKARRERGELRWVFVHVPFRFVSGVVYWADFMTILADGTVEAVWDAKSEITAKNSDYVIKKKTLKAEWGIEICEVYRQDADGSGGFYNPEWPVMGATREGNDSER